MAPSYPSIQSFYKREIPRSDPKQLEANQVASPSGDGFTKNEVEESLDPLLRPWNPGREYEKANIDQLFPGPRAVMFVGRVVNFNTVFGRSAKQPKAAGWHHIIVKDHTAAISLKLYFAHKAYPLRLGQIVSIWTAFISDVTKADKFANTATCANLFPGRDTSDHIMLHPRNGNGNGNGNEVICNNVPLDFKIGLPLAGLMTVGSYLAGGHEVPGAKILACVKSIGAKKKVTIKKTGMERHLREVMLFDHTGELKLSLWGELHEAAKEWQPSITVLLITDPQLKSDYGGKGAISVQHVTMVEVDPDFPDAEWMRKYAISRIKKESLYIEFPEHVWDVEAAVYGIYRTFFTLAEIDEWVRDEPSQIFTGWINVTILEISLVSYYRKRMLRGAECCGLPTFANTVMTPCPHCERELKLCLNPRIIGPVIDETACIATGKLVWSPQAWEDLFGCNMAELGAMALEEIRTLEERILGMRCHLCFGWDERTGRLAILAMRP